MDMVHQTPAENRKYAEECERIARNGPLEHREILLKIANAWRQYAASAEKEREDHPGRRFVGVQD
jgi:hypothetical protein